jgi:hypothetical protein
MRQGVESGNVDVVHLLCEQQYPLESTHVVIALSQGVCARARAPCASGHLSFAVVNAYALRDDDDDNGL